MRTAFLVLAHHQPQHLARLVRNISADWNDVYIHIDRTSELEDFVASAGIDDSPIFLKDEQRIDYTWSGFSSVRAILSLLSVALESGHHYDRFCLLSGADFPIKPLHEIRIAFSKNTEFLRVDRRLQADEPNLHTRAISYFHFVDQKGLQGMPPDGVIERDIYQDIDLYHGAAWWALSYQCIGYVIDYLQSHPEYIEFHKYTFCPDEVFFHSIVKNSPFAAQLSHDFEKEPDLEKYYQLNEHGCHYIDWNSPAETHPKILTPEDSCALFHSDMLFARKIDEHVSHQLLTMLEQDNSDMRENNLGNMPNDQSFKKVWVIGDGRSGTTWLSDLINYDTQYQFIFEPVHPHRRREMRRYDLFTYLRHGKKDENLKQFFNQVFNGKIFTHGSTVPANLPLCPDKILVKDIFSHLMAKWVLNQNPEVKLVILLRHPFSVALSKEKLATFYWLLEPIHLLEQEDLYNDYLQPFETTIRNAGSYFEKQVTIWAIIHYVMFQQLEKDDYLLLFYEKLCRQPEVELERIMNYLGEGDLAVKKAFRNIDYVRKGVSEKELKKRGRENCFGWREHISDNEYEHGCEILRVFGLDGVYDTSLEPVQSSISNSCLTGNCAVSVD